MSKRREKHGLSYQDGLMAGVVTCEGVSLDEPITLAAEDPRPEDRCPRCGDKLRLIWDVYVEEVP